MQTTSRKSKLGSYSALAGSLLAVAGTASAQFRYSDVNPDAVLGFGDSLVIDMDTNGTPDFSFRLDQFTSSTIPANVARIYVRGDPGNAVIGSMYSIYP